MRVMIYRKKMGLRIADMEYGKSHTEVPRRTCLICGKPIPRVIHNDGTFLWWGAHICEPQMERNPVKDALDLLIEEYASKKKFVLMTNMGDEPRVVPPEIRVIVDENIPPGKALLITKEDWERLMHEAGKSV